ncbi:UNVERIFIED_CONTAM: hypothetical protein PYX00_001194 [Menopon gallinae]|uniref:Uncharacterized protein n=1 Tax=Menopon gallinae TaxID=328185 RepID=A0AAW2IBY5_9NEOP
MLALPLPEVQRLSAGAGSTPFLLHQARRRLLQGRLCEKFRRKMLQMLPRHIGLRLGEEGAGTRLPLGLLRLRLVQEAAEHRRGIRPPRRPRSLQNSLPRDFGRRKHVFRRGRGLGRIPQKQGETGADDVHRRTTASSSSQFPAGFESGRTRFRKDSANHGS